MRRRELIKVIAGSAITWPLAAYAQSALPVIGFLSGVSPGPFVERLSAFRQGLNETGFVDGQNVAIEYRWAEGQYDRLPALAVDLVNRKAVVIVAYTDAAALTAKAASTTIPIVFLNGDDPVRLGLVQEPRPAEQEHHRGELVRCRFGAEAALAAARTRADAAVVALLVDLNVPDAVSQVPAVQEVARTLGLQLVVLNARTGSDIDTAFASLVRERAGALVVGAGAFLLSRRNQIIALAARHGIPTIYGFREYSADGGLMSYGNNIADAFRRAGVYTARILKGDKPADLPVERTTKFELVINLKTAKALGLQVPLQVQQRADEMIE